MANPSHPSNPEPDESSSSFEQPDIYMETIQDVQQQQVELKVEIERLHRDVERFRVFFQTLVSGLVITILVSFGIAIWYAYRSFSQQQIARQTADETAAIQEELMGRVEQLEETIQRLERNFPDQLADVSDEVQSSQTDLRQLRDRLSDVEAELEAINNSDASEENNTPDRS